MELEEGFLGGVSYIPQSFDLYMKVSPWLNCSRRAFSNIYLREWNGLVMLLNALGA